MEELSTETADGKDVILREVEAETKLLQLLPVKAQLGFSSLKEHFSQRGEQGLKRFLQSAKPHDAMKLEYTCIDCSNHFIVLGCNFGILFFFDRQRDQLHRFVSEAKQVPIVCLRILASQNFVATGQFNGALTIFNYGKERDGNYKVLLKCTIDNHHIAPVTCIQWTPDGTKLFSGDSEGNVAISVINMDDCQTHTVFICNENSPVTQLSLCHSALLISTLRRSLIWPFNTKMPVQVGQQERKVHGNFGACFYPNLRESTSHSASVLYASRPGLRIWCASLEGKVSATMIFKDSIAKGEPEITTLNLPSKPNESNLTLEPKQFGTLKVFSNYLLSWQGPCLWVIDPNKGTMIGCHNNFGCIVDLCTCNNEIFVLTKADKAFIRKISLENQTNSPLIEVKELNFNQHENDNEGIRRSGSVNQFEETDKLDKLLGDMKNTTVGLIGVVKRNVVKTIEHIKNYDDTEEDKTSSSDNQLSESPSSTSSHEEQLNINERINRIHTTDLTNGVSVHSTPDNIETDQVVYLTAEKLGHNVSIQSVIEENDKDDLLESTTDMNETQIEFTIKQKLREEPVPFHHISEKAFSSDIVFEGTSKQKLRRKKNKRRDPSPDDEPIEEKGVISHISNAQTCVNADNSVSLADENDVCHPVNHGENLMFGQDGMNTDTINSQVVCSLKNKDENETDNSNDKERDEFAITSNVIKEAMQMKEISLESKEIDMVNVDNCTIATAPVTKRDKLEHDLLIDDSVVEENSAAVNETFHPQKVDKTLCDLITADDLNGHESFTEEAKPVCTEQDVNPIHVMLNSKETFINNIETMSGEILTVKILRQKDRFHKKIGGKACKRIDGEAVERAHVRSGSSGCVYLNQEDTIDSNMCWLDDDDEKIDVEDSPPQSPQYREPSLFPAPQMNYQSIYSQETVSISDMSFSEPENNADILLSNYSQDLPLVDSLSMLSISSSEQTDIEDNHCPTPPINLDSSGRVEYSDPQPLQHKIGCNCGRNSEKYSSCSSPSFLDIDAPLPPSPHSMAERVSERLRLLADSWADVATPNCGYIHSVTVTDTLVWCIDGHDHIFATLASSANVNWKKLDGKGRQIAANQTGSIIWNVNRRKTASCRLNVKATSPQGTDWEAVENDILEVAVDDSSVWCIKTNGNVLMRTGVSSQKPQGTAWRNIRVASDLVHITCVGSMIWGLDIYNHVQIYQGNLSTLCGNEQAIQWLELPGISATYVTLGPKGVCWIIDKDGKIWFNLELSEENVFGGRWYELSVGEYLVQDPTVLSTVASFFKRGNQPKTLAGNDIAGLWILSKHGSLHAARGHLLGTRWDLTVPIAMSSAAYWSHISAQGATGNGGFVWALQPNGDLHCFRPESQSFSVHPPAKKVLKYISASPKSLWGLTSNQDLYIRKGICETTPQGLKWIAVNMMSMGNERICSIACGVLVVWAVDYHGNIWFQMGRDDRSKMNYSPAWVQVEGSPFDGCQFTKIAVGSNDCIVWAIDDKNNVYARKEVSESLLIGTAWEIVAGTGAKDITVSDNIVWALCPNGSVVCRFGISDKNYTGNYWKTVPGCFEQISVTADDELWGIDRQGQLYQRHTVHFFGTQATRKTPSYSQLFPTDDDWELI